nr:hypothetical protein [Hyphomonas sp. Mor2]
MPLETILILLACSVALFLTVGETLILWKTDKYWPLSIDDYLVCGLLFFSAFTFSEPWAPLLMLIAWTFMAGNLYAMIFTRLDPKTGTRERIPILAVLMLSACAGLTLSFVHIIGMGG